MKFLDKEKNSPFSIIGSQYWRPYGDPLFTGGGRGSLGLAYSANITQPSRNYKTNKKIIIIAILLKEGWAAH